MRRIFKSYPIEYVRCRTSGHRWDDVTGTVAWTTSRPRVLHSDEEIMRCDRCSMLRRTCWHAATGIWLYTAYRQPRGYRLADYTLPPDATLKEVLRHEKSARAKAERQRTERENGRRKVSRIG